MNRDRILYLFANTALITAGPVVLCFALLGIDVLFGIRTLWGYMFMMIGLGYISACGIAMAINIKTAFKK